MKRSKPSVIPFLIVAAIGAATLLYAPAYASDDVQGITHTEEAVGGGDWNGDPDQPDPTRSSSIARGAMPRIGTGAPRMYIDSNRGSVASPVGGIMSRGWLEAMMWSLRARIGW